MRTNVLIIKASFNISQNTVTWVLENVVILVGTIVMDVLMTLVK